MAAKELIAPSSLGPADLLGSNGPLTRHIQGFAPRVAQQEMAAAVGEALEKRGVLICEAGTGTGKTYAYLVPALLSGQKVILSTGTKNLQDQLYQRDLPLVRDALGVGSRIALLKGRGNYLCLHRLETVVGDVRLPNREAVHHLSKVRSWAKRTRSGDVAEVRIPEDAPIWPFVTSNTDNCLGQDCPNLADCFLVRARRAAQEADLVVVNHYLLMADIALRGAEVGELLPAADAFILDEAHQLPEVATQFMGISLTGRQLQELAQDTINEQVKEAPEMVPIRTAAETMSRAVKDLRLAFGEEVRRAAWREAAARPELAPALTTLSETLTHLATLLEQAKERGKGLESCHRRTLDLRICLAQVGGEAPPDHIHWFETFKTHFALHLTPLDIAKTFQARMAARPTAWVFTSATLAVGERFDHFTRRLGIQNAVERRWESPFDFRRQAVLYCPMDMPAPNESAFGTALVELALQVLTASRGRAFLLFTSHRALQDTAERLTGQLPYPLLVQGTAPRADLLDRFRSLGNAVLLGTSSFWEGVDVRGEALSCVIIDKLPFASPSDPVVEARIDALRRSGADPFHEFQLPHAVITLKQGVGRLIRDITDRGVMVLCDPRLLTKPYGKVFLDSLPPMTRTRKLEVVQRFYLLESLPT
ncbi:putative ATP-dependent DNA helicase HI_0387 [Gammaproteobacteria bacterium]